ncbi:MAG: formyltetrahydrofolate deformylase [Candidatus Nitrosopolaris sp.]
MVINLKVCLRFKVEGLSPGIKLGHLTMEITKTIIEVTVVGNDRKGVVADITNFIFKIGGNIEQVNQNVVRGLFGMQLEASFETVDRKKIDLGMRSLAKKLGMEIKVHYEEPNRLRNIAIFVSKQTNCLLRLLEAKEKSLINANIPLIIGSEATLASIAEQHGITFHTIDDKQDPILAENKILKLTEQYNIDLIILARYMRVLSPNFVWRYPNRIINIHPSLLPAFPGAYAYVQAYERGAKIVGCTAHFVTEDLDQGPIICQDSFRVKESDKLDTIRKKGQSLEADTLLEATKLYLEGKLEVYWGRVHVIQDI